MSLDQHTIEVPDGCAPARTDRTILGSIEATPNAAGAAGATVSTTVTLPASANLPAQYSVIVNPGQGCGWYVDTKTPNSFVVHLVPFTGTASVAAGAFDAVVVA